ncbi:MAG: long-chain fatty acid--CoA ligase [Pseudomonadota bacterium]|nr:long-chain fatty acid--CoA ligase [Pseudomonadota bacterium]
MNDWQEDLITVEAAGTLDGLFYERVRRTPDMTAYRNYNKASRTWVDSSWREVAARVARWRTAIAGEGLEPGERAAIRLRNGLDWVYFDIAVLAEGLVSVPLYPEDRPDNIAYILDDAAVKLLLLQNLAQWKKLLPSLQGNETLQRVLILDTPSEEQEKTAALEGDPRLRFVDDWLPLTAPEKKRRAGDPHGLASIVYTSGTTGRPKGVMLSHYNMLSVAHAAVASVDCYVGEVFLSFLPLSHTLERTAGYYLPMMAGAIIAHARSVPQLAEDLVQVKPTEMMAVPRIFERVHGRIMEQLEKQPAIARSLFHATVRIGWRDFLRRQGRASWSPALLVYPLLKKLVGDKVTAKLGGNIRYAICGGAALPFPVARTFIGLGLEILQGYGLTETSPIISVNRPGNNDPASVGEPCRGIEARIGENDELVVKSPGIMLGYWNNHAATAEMIDPDGWLHTGDQARIEGGRIYITGRIKDILVLSNGEKVPPVDMEAAICLDPLFDQALVVGEGKPSLGAVLVLNSDLWFGFARELGLDPFVRESLENEQLHRKVLSRLRKQLHEFPGYAKIRHIVLTLDPWTVEDDLVTPTLKVKRPRVLERFADQIEALYD